MLEFDGATKRFGAVGGARRVHVRGPARPAHRLPRPERRRQDDRDAGGVRAGRAGRRGGAVAGRTDRPLPSGRGSATCPRSGACTPACGCATSSCTSASSAGGRGTDVGRSVDAWLERLGLADRASDRLDALSHGNQQRVQLIAALVNEPDLLVLDEPFSGLDPIAIGAHGRAARRARRRGRDGAVLQPPARPGRGPVRGRRHHRPRPDRAAPASSTDLRAAVPQRFVDIRYRGAAPDWSRLAVGGGRRGERRPGPAAGRSRHRPRRGGGRRPATATDVVSFAYQPPTLSELFRQAVAA